MFEAQIDNWSSLMTTLEIADEDQPEALSKIRQWFQEHIKSSVTNTRLNELKNLFQTYSELNAAPTLFTIADTHLGYTVAHKAAKLGFDRFLDLNLKQHSEATIKQIMNARTIHGNTPLHLAAVNGHLITIELLIEQYEADARLQNNNNKSALDIAALCENTEETRQCVTLLLMHTPRELYTSDLLFNLVAFDDPTLLDRIVQTNPDFLHSTDLQMQNLLHKAITMRSGKVVDYLYSNKILCEQVTLNSSSIYHLACRYGDDRILGTVLKDETAVSSILSSSIDEHGMTPIQHLEERQDIMDLEKDIYRKLLDSSSDFSPRH